MKWEHTGSNRGPSACKTKKRCFQILLFTYGYLLKPLLLLAFREIILKLAVDTFLVIFQIMYQIMYQIFLRSKLKEVYEAGKSRGKSSSGY